MKPLAHDLFCGLGGWTEGLQAEGYDVIGWDIEQHIYGEDRYPGLLIVQDALTIHGSQLRSADLIVASPPCQEYSYMAMPWKLAKAKAAAIRADETGAALERLNRLFNACFRIQREASEAAGRHIPMVVENVKGAQPWVGRARWNFGSYYLWGDIPALMPDGVGRKVPGFRFDGSGRSFQTASVAAHVPEGRKNAGGSWFKIGSPGQLVTGENPDGRHWKRDAVASESSRSPRRKAASAKIAKIPLALARHIARTYRPIEAAAVNMSAAGGSFGTYLSRLASPGLIERDGGVIRLSADAMGPRP